MDKEKKDAIAQWAFDCRPVLGRFHLWLEDVEVTWLRRDPSLVPGENIGFVDPAIERLFIMTSAVTALGTKLFGRYGDGKELNKKELNQVKKDADAISAYVMSESLWYLSRSLPENHAVMVCLGEGLMPKVGETPEMGSNPLLGFGRVYARPQVAKLVDSCIRKLLNEDKYGWDEFYRELKENRITIWGVAVDTLENTSRFAKGAATGPMSVLHVFDQPLCVSKPYEGYMGNLCLPIQVSRKAEELSILLNFFTPRSKVLEVIQETYPGLKAENVHVWTLRGKSRFSRIGKLWKEWQDLGVHLVDDGWELPTGEVFTDSGTYAPSFSIGTWEDEKGQHLFICDGYAASAEAMQAASLSSLLNIDVFLALFSSKFELSFERESLIMRLDPHASGFAKKLSEIFEQELTEEKINAYRGYILEAKEAGIPMETKSFSAHEFFPEKKWRVMALCGYMLPDPYTNACGVKKIKEDIYEVTVRMATRMGDKIERITLRLEETPEQSRLVFNPLLVRFMRGENYQERAVRVSDSGRIRNELQTLCSEALEHFGERNIRIYFNRIPSEVISLKNQKILREVLLWYKKSHPIWFNWLEVADE